VTTWQLGEKDLRAPQEIAEADPKAMVNLLVKLTLWLIIVPASRRQVELRLYIR